jgi:hypothetical protein
MATTQFVIANNVNTQLAAASSSSATTLTLASSANLPTLSAGQVMPLTLNDAATGQNYEIVYVTAITGVTLTVVRAQEGTGALSWNVGDYAFCPPTAGTVATALGNPSNTFQVAVATAANQAVPASQAAGVIGQARNLVMSITAASATATMTADEIIVETALGGLRYCLASFSQTINLATTGAGGMDTGTAPVSGFVALYAIYNPTTGAKALLATNAATKVGNVYGGANMPAGYTAGALVSVWPTNASSLLVVGLQRDRHFGGTNSAVLSSSTIVSNQSLSISSAAPQNAVSITGYLSVGSTAAANVTLAALENSGGAGQQAVTGQVAATGYFGGPVSKLGLSTQQTIYYTSACTAGTPTFTMYVSGYEI